MLKELEDYSWFPQSLRRWQLQFVGTVSVWTKLYQPVATILQQMIDKNEITALQDLCSGSGKPAVYVHDQLTVKISMLLTDKYPEMNFENKPGIAYSLNPADVLAMQPVENIGYTMFNAFHHFSEGQQKELVNKMALHKTPFVIAEILEPGLLNALKIIFTTTIIQLLTAPFVKPFSLLRLFFTYIIPVNLFTVTYDGIISVLRSKTAEQYSELVKDISVRSYIISVHTIKNWKGDLIYIKGVPINK